MENKEQNLKSIITTGKVMGTGASTQSELAAETLNLPMISSGGTIYRSLAEAWNIESSHTSTSMQGIWEAFEEDMTRDSVDVPIISHSQQNETTMELFRQAVKTYGNGKTNDNIERFIDQQSINNLIENPSVGEGKLLIIAESLGLKNAEGFNDQVVRVGLTLEEDGGHIDFKELGRRILEREVRNKNILSPSEDKKAMTIDGTTINAFARHHKHWEIWEEVYGVSWKDLCNEIRSEDVYMINTRELGIETTHIGILLAYLQEVPQSANILLEKIDRKITTIQNKAELSLQILMKIQANAPDLEKPVQNYIKLIGSSSI